MVHPDNFQKSTPNKKKPKRVENKLTSEQASNNVAKLRQVQVSQKEIDPMVSYSDCVYSFSWDCGSFPVNLLNSL